MKQRESKGKVKGRMKNEETAVAKIFIEPQTMPKTKPETLFFTADGR